MLHTGHPEEGEADTSAQQPPMLAPQETGGPKNDMCDSHKNYSKLCRTKLRSTKS